MRTKEVFLLTSVFQRELVWLLANYPESMLAQTEVPTSGSHSTVGSPTANSMKPIVMTPKTATNNSITKSSKSKQVKRQTLGTPAGSKLIRGTNKVRQNRKSSVSPSSLTNSRLGNIPGKVHASPRDYNVVTDDSLEEETPFISRKEKRKILSIVSCLV